MGIPTGFAPHAPNIWAAPPEALKSRPLMSFNVLTGTLDMIFVGAVVNIVNTLTLANAFGLYFL